MIAPIALIIAIVLVAIVIGNAFSGPGTGATIDAGTPTSLTLPQVGAQGSIAPFIIEPARTVSVVVITGAIP